VVSKNPVVSVIVPVRDGERTLADLMASLEVQTLPRERFEVVVIDNASRDRSAEVARALGAIVCEESRPGRARARNTGCAASRGRLLAFIDADCVARSDWLEALQRCLDRSPLAAGPVEVITRQQPNHLERLDALWRFRELEHNVKQEGWSVTANLGMTREAFDAVGGFDESFRHIGEDLDLCRRAVAAGFGIAWCSGAVVEHPAERELGAVLRRAVAHGYSEEQVARVHGRKGGGQWRRPGPLVRGGWALHRLGIEPSEIELSQRRRLLWLARLEYAGRMLGSAWAQLRVRGGGVPGDRSPG
jgi:GT2 family glycosyltransferase